MQFISFGIIFKRIKAIKALLRNREVPLKTKALVVFGIIYLFLPVDLIPPVLFPVGFIDDIVLWIFILTSLKDQLDSYWKEIPKDDLSNEFDPDNIVGGVKYEVKDEENDNE